MFDQVDIECGTSEEAGAESGEQLEKHESSWCDVGVWSFKRLLGGVR